MTSPAPSLTARALNVRVPDGLYQAARRYAFDKQLSLGDVIRLGLANLLRWDGPTLRGEVRRRTKSRTKR